MWTFARAATFRHVSDEWSAGSELGGSLVADSTAMIVAMQYIAQEKLESTNLRREIIFQ
jgi:hypothetical protein